MTYTLIPFTPCKAVEMHACPHNLIMPFLKVPLSCNHLTSVTVFDLLLCYITTPAPCVSPTVITHTRVTTTVITHTRVTTTVTTHTPVSQPLSSLTHLCHNYCHHSHTCVTTTVVAHTPVSQPLSSLTHLCHNHCPFPALESA